MYFTYIAVLSLLLSIVSVMHLMMNDKESPSSLLLLTVIFIRWMHYALIMTGMTYAFLANPVHDRWFMIAYVCVCISWLIFKRECILSVIEEKVRNPAYTIGEQPNRRAYFRDLFGSWKDFAAYIMHVMFVLNAVIVVWRVMS